MSRFQQFESSASETDSDEDDVKLNERPSGFGARHRNETSDSEDERRVVKTGREKKFDELRNLATALKNHKNNKDVGQISNDFDQLIKCYEKNSKGITQDNYHKFYTRVIGELEDFVNELWDRKKDLSKINSKNLTSLRQKLKKYVKDFEKELEDFKANPSDFPVELIEDLRIKTATDDVEFDGEEEEDDEEESESSSSSDSSSDDEEDKERYRMNPADRFLKTTVEKKKQKKKEKKEHRGVTEKKKEINEAEEGWINVDYSNNKQLFSSNEDVTVKAVLEKISQELDGKNSVAVGGKKDAKKYGDLLHNLLNIVKENEARLGVGIQVKIILLEIGNILQYNSSVKFPCLTLDKWVMAFDGLKSILNILITHGNSITMTLGDVHEPEQLDKAPYVLNNCLVSLCEHIEDEYDRLLTHHENSLDRNVDFTSKLEYETRLIEFCSQLHNYINKLCYSDDLKCRLYIREVEHIYHRADLQVLNKVNELCSFIISNDSTDRLRTRAMLCKIYYLALHGQWFEARDLFAMSAISEAIDKADAATKILYNRVTVQLGLCAFKHGAIKEAHQALSELQGSGRLKELLAQGIRVNQATTAEDLHRERTFLLPYHKHINTDLIEGVYLLSAMITEVNNCFTQQPDGRRVIISRNFHHVLKNSEKNLLVGPPDNLKEHIVAASKSLFNGEWEKTYKYIFNDKMNRMLWRFFSEDAPIKKVVEEKIKVESLKAFFFGFSHICLTIDLARLERSYDLSSSMVKQVVSKMILTGKLMASLDEPSNCIIMHKIRSSTCQANALKLSEKAAQLAELNEKIQDFIRNKN